MREGGREVELAFWQFLFLPYLRSPSHAPIWRASSSVDEVDEGVRDAAERGFHVCVPPENLRIIVYDLESIGRKDGSILFPNYMAKKEWIPDSEE